MNRVIDDPAASGWVLDPDTGYWNWGGSGGGSGGGGASFPEAPVDNKQYGRQNAGWTEIVHTGGGGGGNDPRITDQQITNWDVSFGWGDHKGLYLETETDPTVPQYVKDITQADINKWNSGTGGGGDVDLTGYATEAWVSANYQVKGNYLTSSSLNGYATETWVGQNYQPKGSYAAANHNHSGVYAPATHSHSYVPLSGSSTITGVLTATDFVATSDRNKKEHIETAPTGVIEKLRGVTFQWKDTGKESSGVVAQEIQDAGLGHLVHESDDGLSVAYAGLTAYLIEEVKLLRRELEVLKGD